MPNTRRHMIATLRPTEVQPVYGLRQAQTTDEQQLATLMMAAYVGTIDYDEGETEADALVEIQATLSGKKGPYLNEFSRVLERSDELVSATLIIRWRGLPFVAFTMTTASHKRQGLGKACMVSAMQAVYSAGESQVHLLVTEANVQAVALYHGLGFEFEE